MGLFMFVVIFFLIELSTSLLNISEVFSSHMVLQQANPSLNIPPTHIFGMAFLNETVLVTITGSDGFPGPFKLTTIATKNNMYPGFGNFTVPIIGNESHPSYPGPYTINIQSFSINTMQLTDNLTITDVYFGDVFLCSGQSNMELNVKACDNTEYEQEQANTLPNIRLLNPVHTMSNFTLQSLNTENHLGWRLASNESIIQFSCICWISARLTAQWLLNTTGKKPYLGLIESDIGGTSIHFWAPGIVGEVCNSTGMLPNTGECASKGAPYYAFPGSIYNAMINPLSMNKNGLSIRQAIWYQGEADSRENDIMSVDAYICELNGLIVGWREQFNSSTLPFIVIQLPSGGMNAYGSISDLFTSWAGIQHAQVQTANMHNNVGLVTIQDQGQGTLHYPYKQEVSQRVFLWTRYLSYNDRNVFAEGPMFDVAYKIHPNDLTVYVNFTNTVSGLMLKDAVNCSVFKATPLYIYNNMSTNVKCCEMGGVDTVRMKLDGWFWIDRDEQGHHLNKSVLWDWMPANVSIVGPNTIAATPILPMNGASTAWLSECNSNQCAYLYSEAISIRKIVIGVNPGCVIANSEGIPTAAAQGPYDVVIHESDVRLEIVELQKRWNSFVFGKR